MKLIAHIANKDYTLAEQEFKTKLLQIAEAKLIERKHMLAAQIFEGRK
jgi:hypothetical protein